MTLTVLLKDEKKYIFYGVREYCIEYGKYLKFTYVGTRTLGGLEMKKKYMKDSLY